MIKSVMIGEELTIAAKNRVGLLADIAELLTAHGINIESALGYESGKTANFRIVTNANLIIINELRKKKYKHIEENEVVVVELRNRPGALRSVTSILKKAKIDIEYLYVTTTFPGEISRMILQTSNNEEAIALLSKAANPKA